MKTLASVALVLLAVFALSAPEALEAPIGSFPSSVKESKRGFSVCDAVLMEGTDFRLMFSELDHLMRRVDNSQCIIDEGFRNRAHLVVVKSGSTLRDVLKASGHNDRSEGPPQIRVIKRNAIVQSAKEGGIDVQSFDLEAFFGQKILPGDIVVFAKRT